MGYENQTIILNDEEQQTYRVVRKYQGNGITDEAIIYPDYTLEQLCDIFLQQYILWTMKLEEKNTVLLELGEILDVLNCIVLNLVPKLKDAHFVLPTLLKIKEKYDQEYENYRLKSRQKIR